MATEDYCQLKDKFIDDVQDRYESVRPLVLFENISIKERAKQIGSTRHTISKRVTRFKEHGMKGLFDNRELSRSISKWDIPQDVIHEIFNLLSIYHDFKYTEICQIIHRKFEYQLTPYQVKKIIKENPYPIQSRLPIIPTEPYHVKLEAVKLYYAGWKVSTIAIYLKISREYVHKIINIFERDNFSVLIPKSKAPKQHDRKVFFPIINKVYQIQKDNPRLGHFRVWGKLKKQLKEEEHPIEISQRTVARIMAINRKLYPELIIEETTDEQDKIKKMPFKSKYRHHYWFIDILYNPTVTGQ